MKFHKENMCFPFFLYKQKAYYTENTIYFLAFLPTEVLSNGNPLQRQMAQIALDVNASLKKCYTHLRVTMIDLARTRA